MAKLLLINSAKNYGSTGMIAEQIGLLATSSGWDICMVNSERYVRSSKLKSIVISSKAKERVHAVVSYIFDRHGLASVSATNKLVESIKDYMPDVIHLHNIHGYYLNYPILFKYLASAHIPIVWTMHDCWSFTGHCTYFDMIGCEKWKTHCENCQNLDNYPKALLDHSYKNYDLKRKFFTNVDNMTMVPVSEWLGNLTKQSFMGKYPIKVIHNGIDITTFDVKKSRLRDTLNLQDKFVILGVSSNGFTGRKGLDDFVKLAQMVPDGYQIIMIGLKKDEFSKLPQNIIGMGRTANVEELVEYYNLADVFINPTYSDNFPTTNIEALACGTPVVTYNTGGSPEAVDENTGIVVPQGDCEALYHAVETVRMNGKLFYEDKCRERAVRLFDKNKCFQEYIDLYNAIQKKDVL